MNSLPKTVTRQRRDCDFNTGPSATESSALTARLPSRRAAAWFLVIIHFLAFYSQVQLMGHIGHSCR